MLERNRKQPAYFMLALFLFTGILLADELHIFSEGELVSSSAMNANFQKMPPVGGIIAWHKNLTNTPALPDGWIECNGQPINDSESVYDGQTAPNLNNAPNAWNAAGVFLRGGTTSGGAIQNDQFQDHGHDPRPTVGTGNQIVGLGARTDGQADFPNVGTGPATGWDYFPLETTSANFDVGSGTPRTGTETRPVAFQVVWIMRIK